MNINRKFAVGTTASSKYDQKVEVFNRVHEKIAEKSNLFPLNCYFGKKPEADKDPFNRRIVKQLNDIDFSEDSEDDFEDVRSLKRQRRLILTEENLRLFLSAETLKINLEHHHWLKPSFISKIGKMAPNLVEVNLRRLKLTNQNFEELVYHFHKVEVLDISECPLIEDKGVLKFF